MPSGRLLIGGRGARKRGNHKGRPYKSLFTVLRSFRLTDASN